MTRVPARESATRSLTWWNTRPGVRTLLCHRGKAFEEVANPMTRESDAAAIGAVRASCDADLEHERPGILSGSFSVFGRGESAERAAG
jgi:hypothetical protein